MMQRLCVKFRCFALHSPQTRRLLHHSSLQLHVPLTCAEARPNLNRLVSTSSAIHDSVFLRASCYPIYPPSLVQLGHYSTKSEKKRKRLTPVTSKVKKIKIKGYSSYKGRFRLMNDGNIRRWKEGKRHNAHSKSKTAKRRLRQPGIVPAAYAKVMKKLNFGA